ncbi:MAG: hypothetical protein WCT12_32910 [Verrucomicrobiota bacterium]
MKKTKSPKEPSKVEANQLAVQPTPQPAEAVVTIPEVVPPLSIEEKKRLATLEKVIESKLGDFFKFGSAIMEIKNKMLYRDTHPNFHTYCQERWGIGRSYANKLIGSAKRLKLLPKGVTKPTSEFQMRPFLKLKPEEFPKKWPAIVKTAVDGKVTFTTVEESLGLKKKNRKKRTTKGSDDKKKVQDLLTSIRESLNENKVAEALDHLTNLENLLNVRTLPVPG